MAENVVLNPGVGGSTLRTLRDAGGKDWPVGVTSYATTILDGANVVQIVDSTHGLPVSHVGAVEVEQATAANLLATVSQGGSWTVAATQSGAWAVTQSTPANLKTEATLAAGSTVAIAGSAVVAQATAANLNATVAQGGVWVVGLSPGAVVAATQSGAWSVGVSGTVTVAQPTAANLLATVTQAGPVTVQQSTAASLKTEATLASGSAVALNAGTALVGKVAAGADTATVYNGATALTPKFAKIAASASGDNAVVALVSGKKIRVLRWSLVAADDVSVKWRSGSTDLTGLRSLVKYAAAGGAYCPVGCFETAAGEALNLNLSVAKAVGGELTYVEV